MASTEIRITGDKELLKKLSKNLDKTLVKNAVKRNGSQLETKAKREAEKFKGHYEWVKGQGKQFVRPTGHLKDSINTELTDGGMTAEVAPHTEYAAYVEFGTRFMDAQPYLKPAFDKQIKEFRKDLERCVK